MTATTDTVCREVLWARSPSWGRVRRGLGVAAVVYAVAACILTIFAPQTPHTWRMLPDWVAAPSQLIAIAGTASVVWECWRWRRPSRAVIQWALIAAFCIMSLVANYAWNVWRPLGRAPALSFPDVCYLVDYALLTLAYGVAYVRLGGSFRDPGACLDAVTIVVALLGTFWATFLGTFLPMTHGPRIGAAYALTYALSLSVWMSMASLLFLRMPSIRSIFALLIGAGLADALWELGWLATRLTDHNYVGVYYNFGDVLCCTLITCAAAMTADRTEAEGRAAEAERSAYGFVPTLTALLAIALVGSCLASTRQPDAWILVGLVILTALLLFTRQAAARRKLTELNRSIAMQEADARLMELVRQSTDAFLVIDAAGIVEFASPATVSTVGVSPAQVVGRPAATLFGANHETLCDEYLRRLVTEPGSAPVLELTVESPREAPRILKLQGANRLDNPHIEGLTLTISDISEQRSLERDVLTAANHERLALAGDIHDGLGQELSGILLMLHSLTTASNPGGAQQQAHLKTIVGHVADAIRGTRDLARGLSPIYVVRGSLRDALYRLATEVGHKSLVHVDVEPLFQHLVIDELPADHLYRIAREAVQNSIRHGACSRIDVRLHVVEDNLLLEVSDNGVGYGSVAGKDSGFGLRLMEYRARVIGALFEIMRRPEGGTIARVTVQLWNVAKMRPAP